jgi:hypothetical protein
MQMDDEEFQHIIARITAIQLAIDDLQVIIHNLRRIIFEYRKQN